MPPRNQSDSRTLWMVIAVACLFFGSVLGYVIGSFRAGAPATSQAPAPQAAPAEAATGAPGSPPALVDEQQVQTYRNILARDPRNVQAAVQLGNIFYDAGRYGEAIPLYQQAFSLDPRNVEVSTDLGTALWYSGRPDEALAQFQKSLAISPTHPQTLFNMGIVKLDGKQDPKGAIEAWERLLKTNPTYPNQGKVQELLARARQRAGS